jgi:hypothetical protein
VVQAQWMTREEDFLRLFESRILQAGCIGFAE